MLKTILPAILTIVGNLIFYLWIKGRVDKSIERQKTAYSGVFKEKIDIYRELLRKTYSIKKELNRFRYVGTKEEGSEIMQNINDYIQFYNINQPFLSDSMLSDLKVLRSEFQDIFENFYMHISNKDPEDLTDFFKAGNKLRSNKPFEEIENRLIKEMRDDLRIKEFNKK